MKFFYTIFFLLVVFIGHSQTFAVEHNYEEGNVELIHLDYSGDKYLVVDREEDVMNFYNLDHSLWKSVTLPIPEGFSIAGWTHISENMINLDDDLEIAFTFTEDNSIIPVPNSRIIREDGTVLASNNQAFYNFSQISGLDTLLFVTGSFETQVYSLQGLVLQGSYSGRLTRVNLEVSGEKYYKYNSANQSVEIFNPDFSLWKTLPLALPPAASSVAIRFVTQTLLNDDPFIEVAFEYATDLGNFTTEIISENNTSLFSMPTGRNARINNVPGLQSKLFIDSVADGQPSVQIFSMPSLQFENEYNADEVRRVNLEVDGEVYFTTNLDAVPSHLTLYNSNHEFWKQFILYTPNEMYRVFHVGEVSQTKLASDNKIEVIYSIVDDILLGMYSFESRIVNESGLLLYVEQFAKKIHPISIEGDTTKLISEIDYQDFLGNTILEGNIIDFDNEMRTPENNLANVFISYDPEQRSISLSSSSHRFVKADIYDLAGRCIVEEDGSNIVNIDVSHLSTGTYIAQLHTSAKENISKKIIIYSK